ncbi:hypothetical protein E2986_12847, partial [Frieseomelitta varia]
TLQGTAEQKDSVATSKRLAPLSAEDEKGKVTQNWIVQNILQERSKFTGNRIGGNRVSQGTVYLPAENCNSRARRDKRGGGRRRAESKMPGGTSTRESSEAIRMEPLGRTSSSRSPGQNGTANTTTEVPINSVERHERSLQFLHTSGVEVPKSLLTSFTKHFQTYHKRLCYVFLRGFDFLKK